MARTMSDEIDELLEQDIDQVDFGEESHPLKGVCSDAVLAGIERYVNDHEPVGHFLTAVFRNDLFEAVARVDEQSYAALRDIVRYIYNHTPASCWSSPEKVRAWLQQR